MANEDALDDVEVISTKIVTARMDHACSFCKQMIRRGDRYNKDTVKVDGSLSVVRSHLVCL